MLRPKPFDHKTCFSLKEALHLLDDSAGGIKILAGGTDLLPNLKHRLYPETGAVLSLRNLPELRGVETQQNELIIGAGERLADLSSHPALVATLPALAATFGTIASPQIRNMATLGGNLCLDTRCRYINQTDFWRQALGGCLKSHGDQCHVVPGGKNCVAAFSGDAAIALIALEAEVELLSVQGQRRIPLVQLYRSNGAAHLALNPNELLSRIFIPLISGRKLAFRKWSVRRSIDFPLVNLAVRMDSDAGGNVQKLVAVVGVLAAKPKVFPRLADLLESGTLDARGIETIADFLFRKCAPLPNVPYDPGYRKEMLRVQARRALHALLQEDLLSVRQD